MILILPDRTQPYPTKILLPQSRLEWRTPSQAQSKDCFGNEDHIRFQVTARLNDGYIVWRGWFQDREDCDAFLFAMAVGSIHQEPALWRLPVPNWHPDFDHEGVVWECLTQVFKTVGSGTYTLPGDFDVANNTVEGIAAGGGGCCAGNIGPYGASGGAGGMYCKISNISASASYVVGAKGTGSIYGSVSDSTAGTDTSYSTLLIAKGGPGTSSNGDAGGTAPATTAGTGTTKHKGGNGGSTDRFSPEGCDGGDAATPTADGTNGTQSGAGTNGSNGTQFDATHGSGTRGKGGTNSGGPGGIGGNYGAGGGGGGSDGVSTFGNGGNGADGILYIAYTPFVAKGFPNLAMMGL